MNTRKIIGILLVAGGITLGYVGIDKITQNNKSVDVLDVKIDLSNTSKKQDGYMFLGAAILLFAGGLYTLNKK